jgi:CO dehydrogenase/acetyl-CoA synthase beta subunit
MKLYDNLIDATMTELSRAEGVRSSFDRLSAWKCLDNSEFIMQRDAALELGGAGMPSVNYTCVTTSGKVTEDEVIVYGNDINQIKGDTAFARIVILETGDLGEEQDQEKAFQAIRNLEFVRYHVFPEGYMVRVSSQSNQEQVRISSNARNKGINFARVGAAYIAKYKELDLVRNVRVIFITRKELVETLMPNADKVDAITKTLTHILDGMPTDCGHCSMKPVCDEVEGMRELHLGKKKK